MGTLNRKIHWLPCCTLRWRWRWSGRRLPANSPRRDKRWRRTGWARRGRANESCKWPARRPPAPAPPTAATCPSRRLGLRPLPPPSPPPLLRPAPSATAWSCRTSTAAHICYDCDGRLAIRTLRLRVAHRTLLFRITHFCQSDRNFFKESSFWFIVEMVDER